MSGHSVYFGTRLPPTRTKPRLHLPPCPNRQVICSGREATSRRWYIRALPSALCAASRSSRTLKDGRQGDGRDCRIAVEPLLHDPEEAVTHVAVAFDNPIRSFRNDLFPLYKSDEGVPPELRAQFAAAERAVSSIGVTVWSMREYEADDGLASGARRFRDQVDQVRILTPDKDLGKCLYGDRVVQVDRRQKKFTSEE